MAFVYRYIDEYETVKYVGKTVNLAARHADHLSSSDKHHETFRNCRLEYIGGLSRADSDILETYFISLWNPPCNISKKTWGKTTINIPDLPDWKEYPNALVLSEDTPIRNKLFDETCRCDSCGEFILEGRGNTSVTFDVNGEIGTIHIDGNLCLDCAWDAAGELTVCFYEILNLFDWRRHNYKDNLVCIAPDDGPVPPYWITPSQVDELEEEV